MRNSCGLNNSSLQNLGIIGPSSTFLHLFWLAHGSNLSPKSQIPQSLLIELTKSWLVTLFYYVCMWICDVSYYYVFSLIKLVHRRTQGLQITMPIGNHFNLNGENNKDLLYNIVMNDRCKSLEGKIHWINRCHLDHKPVYYIHPVPFSSQSRQSKIEMY